MAEIVEGQHVGEGDEGDYRDHISTVDNTGKRIWIYPKKPSGKFYNWRKIVSYVLLAFLIVMPFIKVNGRQFVQLNVLKSEFTLFGVYFAPQDFHIFVIGMLIAMVFIALFTVVFGRLFCGWICPQTIFMEMFFRRIEYWIEGDANKQKKLNRMDWTGEKIRKKVLKHAIFIAIAIFISHLFLAYIIGVDEVFNIVTSPLGEHWKGFIAMLVFSAVFYGVFAFLREQVCTTICPYGRMQSVLLVEDSLNVAYDFTRGEPRGKIRKSKKADSLVELPVLGDCIDCNLCVKVCPTGIDIRNGTQLECVNCTACMDACDEVMEKIDKPKGLIRIDSYNSIIGEKKSFWTPRAMAYSVVLILLVSLEAFLLFSRSETEVLFLRTPGTLYQKSEDGYISNLYNYQLVNKTDSEKDVTFKVDGMEYIIFETVGQPPRTKANGNSEGAVFIKIPRDKLKGRKTELTIDVYGDGQKIDAAETTFLGPG